MTKRVDGLGATIVFLFVVFNFLVWQQIIFAKPASQPELYFLDVGQGDAELLVLPPGVKILTDAGPDKKITAALGQKGIIADRYVDLAVISHPQLDHFGGFLNLLDYYDFGAFIINGRDDSPAAEWSALVEKIKSKNIPLITLGRGDRIQYGASQIDILSPDKNYVESGELNDTAIVELIKTPIFKTILASDIGSNIEDFLVKSGDDLRADILKVAHHGSKYSTSAEFLTAVRPRLSIIEVGAGNNYGHPTNDALGRLKEIGSQIFRTDLSGTIKVLADNNKLSIFAGQTAE